MLVLIIIEFLCFYLDVSTTQKTSVFCHFFGALYGFASGLKLYKNKKEYSDCKYFIGQIGILISLFGFLLLLILNVALKF
jgi:hypothetical protein